MVNVFSELPLAIFTTMMPAAAGTFIGLFVIAISAKGNDDAIPQLDKATLIPLALLVVGFVGAFFHLHDATHAVFALSHIGSSPLSNEIAVACVFTLCAATFWICERAGKLSGQARVIWLGVLAALGLVLAIFTGLAYHVRTIPAWASALVPVELACYALSAASIGALSAAAADIDVAKASKKLLVISVIGFVGAVAATAAHLLFAGSLEGAYVSGAQLVAAAVPFAAAGAICGIVGVAVFAFATRGNRKHPVTPLACTSALLVVAIFCARLAFYCLQLNVGV